MNKLQKVKEDLEKLSDKTPIYNFPYPKWVQEKATQALAILNEFMEGMNIDYQDLYYDSLKCIRQHQTFKDREFKRVVEENKSLRKAAINVRKEDDV